MNLLVVVLGMWNGMVLLPVLLSWMGPAPYLTATMAHSAVTSQEGADNNKEAIVPAGHDNPSLDNKTEENYAVNKYMSNITVHTATVDTPTRLPRHTLIWNDHLRDFEISFPCGGSEAEQNSAAQYSHYCARLPFSQHHH